MTTSIVVDLPHGLLAALDADVRTASWFAALGEPPTDGDRTDAMAYAAALGFDVSTLEVATGWPQAEAILQLPEWSSSWWDCEEKRRRDLLARAETRFPEQPLWTALTDLTTGAGDLVHGKAATAAARLGGAARPSIHVAAGAASQAVYQLAVARLAGDDASPFESKFRLFAAGRWPLGISGSRLFLF